MTAPRLHPDTAAVTTNLMAALSAHQVDLGTATPTLFAGVYGRAAPGQHRLYGRPCPPSFLLYVFDASVRGVQGLAETWRPGTAEGSAARFGVEALLLAQHRVDFAVDDVPTLTARLGQEVPREAARWAGAIGAVGDRVAAWRRPLGQLAVPQGVDPDLFRQVASRAGTWRADGSPYPRWTGEGRTFPDDVHPDYLREALGEVRLRRSCWYALIRVPEGEGLVDYLLQLHPSGGEVSWRLLSQLQRPSPPTPPHQVCVFWAAEGLSSSELGQAACDFAPTDDPERTPGPDDRWLVLRKPQAAPADARFELTDDRGDRRCRRPRPLGEGGPTGVRFVISPGRTYDLTLHAASPVRIFEGQDLAALQAGGTWRALTLAGGAASMGRYGGVRVEDEDGAYDDMDPEDHEDDAVNGAGDEA